MKYNSIGEQLIAKAKELDPSYKPDKFNDMSEAINIILNNSGGGGKSVPSTLNLFDFETGEVRTTITEEEYNNLKNGLYNSVNYYTETFEEAYLQSKLLSIYDDKDKTLSCNFSSIKINVTSETDISLTNIIYDLTIGQKDTNGNYPITIEKLLEVPFGSNSGGGGASLNVVTIDNFNKGDHNQQGFVMPTEDVVLFTDNALVSLIGCKNVQNGVISYICSQWMVSVKDEHYRYVCNFYEITKSTGGYHIETTELGISPEFLPNYSGNDNGKVLSVVNGKTQWTTPTDSLTLPSKPPYSQLIPSITTSNEQQNLTIGNGLEIKDGALISNLSNFKYGTLYLKNITSNANSYTIELSFFDYIYDVIINGTNQLMGTSLTRDTFPSFLKNNITPELFTLLISNIIDVHRKVALMPYFDVTIIDQINNAIFANCSTVIEGIVGFFCGTNDIDLSNITFGDTFTVEYYGSWYGD